ncbi:AP-4 complex subunit beta-1-like [Littorina saxatilis]|uniref:AP complex subunit beta n=1 Tax=Littorina saxatilis TaxID=31220 RepID=A0AAN9GHJ9_9CAEN
MAVHRLDREKTVLAKQLQDPLIMGDDYQRRFLLAKVLSYTNEGEDMYMLLPSMVKLLAHPDLCVKKLAGEVLIQHRKDTTEMVLLAINTLVQDAEESNPMIRGLALRTLSSLHHEAVTEHLERILVKTLSDRSAQVRRVAVLACAKLYRKSPSSVREAGIIDILYGMIRDPDPTVVINCLSALEEILKEEGGVVINKAIAYHLVKKLQSFPTWSQVQVLVFLKKYSLADEEEAFDVMNATDFCLEQNSATVVVTCLELFLHLLRDLPHLHAEVFKRSQASLTGHLSSGNVELIYFIINVILGAPKEAQANFSQNFHSFFCHNKDPLYLKLKKIEILPRLITEENGISVLEELSLYCVSGSTDVSLHAIRALGLIQQEKLFLSEACCKKFQALIQSSSPSIVSNLLQVLQDLEIAETTFWENLLSPKCQSFNTITDDNGRAAFLYLLGEHLCDCEDAFRVVEQCVDEFDDLKDRHVKVHLLDAATKMFLVHPFELQGLLGSLLEMAAADSDLEVKTRACFLYRLLESGADTAKAVLLNIPT